MTDTTDVLGGMMVISALKKYVNLPFKLSLYSYVLIEGVK